MSKNKLVVAGLCCGLAVPVFLILAVYVALTSSSILAIFLVLLAGASVGGVMVCSALVDEHRMESKNQKATKEAKSGK